MDVMKILEALQDNEAFVQAMAMVNSSEELQEVLKKHGIELTIAEIEELVALASQQGEGELSDADLDDISGGALRLPRLPIPSRGRGFLPLPFPLPIGRLWFRK